MEQEAPVKYGSSPELSELLRSEKLAIVASSPQANQLLLIHTQDSGKLHLLMRTVGRPTGIFYLQETLGVYCRNQIWLFTKTPKLKTDDPELSSSDWICSPQKSFVTGNLYGHQMRVVKNHIVFVNTLFSCLATVDDRYSFKPIWKPQFISALLPEDRCHMNGFCLGPDGEIKFVTALGSTDSAQGWRENQSAGGVIIDAQSNEVVASSLCMPHSPVLLADALLFAEAGKGAVAAMDLQSKQIKTCVNLPGFVRGMTLHGNLLFVCTSVLKDSSKVQSLPVVADGKEIECGIFVFSLPSFELKGRIKFEKGIQELFDIAIVPNVTKPHLVGFHDDTVDKIVTVP